MAIRIKMVKKYMERQWTMDGEISYCAFKPQAARASKWPEVIHFLCEPAASSSESGAACFGR